MSNAESSSNSLEPLFFEVNYWHRRNLRRGNHATLNKRKMEVSGRKPWKQKGTGRARAGGFDSPIWVGGAVAHGPQPRDYSFRISRKKLIKARKEAYKIFEAEGRFKKVEFPSLSKPSTKEASKWLKSVVGDNYQKCKVLILLGEKRDLNFFLSVRNMRGVSWKYWRQLSAVDFLDYDYIICPNNLGDSITDWVNNGIQSAGV